jgi:hypothetical protein
VILFLGVLCECALVLIPHQPVTALGAELLSAGIVAWQSSTRSRGAAKEGLIKQRAGAKAARRVAAATVHEIADPQAR